MFRSTLRKWLSQGDIFGNITLPNPFLDGRPPAPSSYLVISNGCEFDKKARLILVAPVIDASTLPGGKINQIKSGDVRNMFYVAPDGARPERFVNFRYIQPIERQILVAADAAGQRWASLTDESRNALVGYLFVFITRSMPPVTTRFGPLGQFAYMILSRSLAFFERRWQVTTDDDT